MPTKRNQDLLDLRYPADKKASKPLMEKRRRARINHSLAQLKALVIDPNTTERSRQAKLEKADILELTVRHLHEVKRHQRTAFLLEAKHPKKKFEIGYAECVREVELFLSNLMIPESSGFDVELQKRLKEHLNKRLQDFVSIEPLEASSKKETSDEEVNDDLSSSPSSSVPSTTENLPLSADTEESDSVDSSALNKMLKYYADEKRTLPKDRGNLDPFEENFSTKRLKKSHPQTNGEDPGISFSCQSVTSTTGYRSTDVPAEEYPPKSEKHFEDVSTTTIPKARHLKKCFISRSERSDLPNTSWVTPAKPGTEAKAHLPKSSSQGKSAERAYPGSAASPSQDDEENNNKGGSNQKLVEQIPLVPRQLANGDWALVLPASLVPTARQESYPFSAFRLVVPTNSTSPDLETDVSRQGLHASSPLSSTVSDMSYEEFSSRSDGESVERIDHSSPDSTQIVWRPW